MGYILGTDQPSGCIFCTKPAEQEDGRNLIVGRATHCFTILNRYPYNNGHLMVVPYRHTNTLAGLETDEYRDLFDTVRHWDGVLRQRLNPHGLNIGLNLGQVAGAGIADHLHVHLVPRWNGDTNFMPVLSDTRVVSQSLQDAYHLLSAPASAERSLAPTSGELSTPQ